MTSDAVPGEQASPFHAPAGRMVGAASGEPAGAAVRLVGVVHLYGEVGAQTMALAGVDLDIAAGEAVALLGPSGSGKSTVLNILSGRLRPTAGRVLIAGRELTTLGDAALARFRATTVGMVLQEPGDNLLPYATALQNVAFAQRAAASHGVVLRSSAPRVLETLGLSPLAHRPVVELSGGEQQRVAIACGLAAVPRLLLVDEPTSQLDDESARSVLGMLDTAHHLLGTTVVVVTHDRRVASAMPRTVDIRAGRISGEGRSGRTYAVVSEDGAVALPAAALHHLPPGTLFTVVVDGERIVLQRADPPGQR